MHGLVSYRCSEELGRYVATELWLELGRYVATELWLELGRYVATERDERSVVLRFIVCSTMTCANEAKFFPLPIVMLPLGRSQIGRLVIQLTRCQI
ncbi:hypothetical protein DY000_02054780 [Brassica cretica]|uniref:Uncharacterized protein n=1 Tax=Brassica cretica TaxID=69181 RepID=A0ABQ7A9E6_BRACR|nr:hypothetical protein DY000_02054780 [Brassica cretica]